MCVEVIEVESSEVERKREGMGIGSVGVEGVRGHEQTHCS